jgi:cysteine synthase A
MPANLDRSVIDEVHWLNDREAFAATGRLAAEQQLFGGNTAGSVYQVVRHLAERAAPGTTLVALMPDRGDRYAGTVYDRTHWAAHGLDRLTARPAPEPIDYGTPVTAWSYAWLRPPGAPRRLAFVESNTTGTGMVALSVARELGLAPALYTADAGRYPDAAGTGAAVLDCPTHDLAGTGARIGYHDLAGITTTSDYYLAAVAELAQRAGLPGNDPAAVAICRDKGRTRRALADAGVAQPRFAVARSGPEVARAVSDVGLPCVVKPVDDSGSTNVRLCSTVDNAVAHAERVFATRVNVRGQPAARVVLVEEFVPGDELSVETFSRDGQAALIGVAAKRVGCAPYFVELGHTFPAPLAEPVAAAVFSTVDSALKAVGYRWGPAHTEVKLGPDDKVAVVEINARLAGGMIPELITLAYGIDPVRQQLCACVGRHVDLAPTMSRHAGIRFLTADRTGILRAVAGLAEASAVAHVHAVRCTARVGAAVGPPVDAYGRLGYVIAAADQPEQVAAALDEACARIRPMVEEVP